MENIRTIEATSSGKELTGIGGWLSFRILVYIFSSRPDPLLFVTTDRTVAHFLEVLWGFFASLRAFSFSDSSPSGSNSQRSPKGFQLAIGMLALLVDPTMGIRVIIGGAIWLMYFYKSVRIKNTYLPSRSRHPRTPICLS